MLNRLAIQMNQTGLVTPGITPRLAMVIGKIKHPTDTQLLRDHFAKMGWRLFDTEWLVTQLKTTAGESYFDSVAHVVSKLILRNNTPA